MEKRLAKKRSKATLRKKGRSNSEINDLPDPLLCHILSFLQTKDSVRSSLLSKRWRNLWLQVPVFDLDSLQFHYDGFSFSGFINNDVSSFMEFVDRFLKSDEKLTLNRFNLTWSYEDLDDDNDGDDSVLASWIDTLLRRRVRHLDFHVNSDDNEIVCMPRSLYSCDTLASLSLYHVSLSGLDLASAVSLPCLKVMRLDRVTYDKYRGDESNLETLVASCPVLEKLTVIKDPFEFLETMRVRSKSLKSLTLGIEDDQDGLLGDDHVVEIDAPKLEHMSLSDYLSGSIIIHSIAPYAYVNIDVNFVGKDSYALDLDDDDDSKRIMVRNFLSRISTVSRMEISSVTLQVINDYSKLELLPQFSNLSWLYASFIESLWELLPTVLGCCPNLHTLFLEFEFGLEGHPIKLTSVPPCFVSSLKYVELAPGTTKTSSQMELARFFIRNCAVLKKLTLSGSFSDDIIKKIKKMPRRSRRCIIVTG